MTQALRVNQKKGSQGGTERDGNLESERLNGDTAATQWGQHEEVLLIESHRREDSKTAEMRDGGVTFSPSLYA